MRAAPTATRSLAAGSHTLRPTRAYLTDPPLSVLSFATCYRSFFSWPLG